MIKVEKCKCENFSCDSMITKINDNYEIDKNNRFRFVKENNCITDRITLDGIEYKGGITENDISHCEFKHRISYRDKDGFHEIKNNYSEKGGHMERSLANDNRKKGHKEHFKKKNKRQNLDNY
jgi:hypothetical protein